MPLDFPNNPTSGQTYIDSDNNLWTFDGTQWGSEIFDDITNLNGLRDYNDLSPQIDDYIVWNDELHTWEAVPWQRIDYLIRVGFSANYNLWTASSTIEFDTVIEEQISSGIFNPTTHEITIPMSGYYQIDLQLQSISSSDIGASYGARAVLTLNGAEVMFIADTHPNGNDPQNIYGTELDSYAIIYWFKYGDKVTLTKDGSLSGICDYTKSFWQLKGVLI